MPAQTTLLHAAPGTALPDMISRYQDLLSEKPLTTWMLLPTKRLVRMVHQKLSASQVTFISDHICTPDQFCEYLITRYGAEKTYINPQAARILLYEVMRSKEKDLSLFFTDKTLSPRTLSELQMLIQVITRREIEYPDCLGTLQSEKSRQIQTIITAYRDELEGRNLVDGDTLLSWTVGFLNGLSREDRGNLLQDVLIYGLFEPMPLEGRLISAVRDTAESVIYTLPSGEDPTIFSDNGAWLSPDIIGKHPSTEVESSLTRIFCHEPGPEGEQLSIPHLKLAGFSDPVTELCAVSKEMARLYAAGIPYEDMTLVSPDIRSTLSYAEEILTEYNIPWHASSARLLIHSPLIAYYLLLFDLFDKGMRYEELIRVIQSPYFSYSWNPDDEPDARYTLSYDNLDLICRAYGLDGGYIDWEVRFSRIRDMITDKEAIELTGPSARPYHPRMPLPPKEMGITIEGTLKLLTLLKNITGKKTIREHIDQFLEILTKTGSPVPGFDRKEISQTRSLTDEEFRDLQSFHAMLQELKSLSLTGIVGGNDPHRQVPVSSFTTAIRQLLLDRPGDPGTSDTGVLLTGIREAAHQHYRIVFLISLNEGVIPRLSTRLPFTTSGENSRMDTRTLSDILRQEKYQFIAALLSGDEQVYLSYYEHKSERTTLPSLFLDNLKKSTDLIPWGEKEGEESLVPSLCGIREAAFTAGSLLHQGAFKAALSYLTPDEPLREVVGRITIERNMRFRLNRSEYDGLIGGDPAIRSRLSEKFAGRFTWSSSMLETYAKCPFRFYLERVVRIRPLPDLGSDIPPETRGSLIHTVLSRFYRKMKEEGNLPLNGEKFEEARIVMREIAEEEFVKVPYATPLWLSKRQQMAGGDETGEGMFDRFIRAETERLTPDGKGNTPHTYTPHLFEFSFGAVPGPDDDPGSSSRYVNLKEIADEWDGSSGEEKGDSPCKDPDEDEIRFVGKIDRVDVTPDNLFGIVDYKTGIHVPGSSDLSRGAALQLPLYLLAYWKISGNTPVFGSYCQIQRKIDHTIPLYDPRHKSTLPRGRLPRSDPKWHELLSTALASSCSYVQAVRDGTYPIHAGVECKKDWYCPYKTICRFQPDRGSRLGEWFLCPDTRSSTGGDC